ncbi:ABC transporter family substrate-binding protein [Cumulibacter manganitolerans]|uniref:ABC transporter family substrate-binding protein n=1 Tax=Cumulibacter manganitolerans TaxID=1884992 RepID=UPI001885AE6B|nr:ABC transporter family substrate-binding protein [Cumulibacter manganitolerans]
MSAAMLAGCSTASDSSSSSSGSAAGGGKGTLCPDDKEAAFHRPKVDESGGVTVGVEEIAHDYNNNTGAANNFANSGVSALLQPWAYIADSKLNVCQDGDLLDSVKVTSKDPQTVEYKISQKAVWSDGQPVACKDFYLQWLQAVSKGTTTGADGKAGPAFDPAGTSGYDQMQPPECPDGPEGKTVKTVYDTPYPDWKAVFTGMVPAHVVEKAAGGVDVTSFKADDTSPALSAFAQQYISLFSGLKPESSLSAGPYKLQSASEEQVVLVRNDKYWGPKGGPESITLKAMSDGQSQVQALQNQEVQVIQPQPDGALASQLKSSQGVVFNAYAGATYEHIDFNMSLPMFQGDDGKAIRKAFFQCVDRQEIIDKLVADVNPDTKPLGSFMFMPTQDGYKDIYKDVGKGDVKAAAKTLEDAGFKKGADGIYEKNGKKVEFRLGHKVIDNRAQISQLVQASCAKAGMKINDDVDQVFNSERLPASDFDTALFAWVGTPFKTASIPNYETNGGANYNKYSNPEFDKIAKQALQELDAKKLDDDLHKMDQIMADDQHSLPLYQFSDMVAQVEGLSPTLTYSGSMGGALWNAYEWVLKK